MGRRGQRDRATKRQSSEKVGPPERLGHRKAGPKVGVRVGRALGSERHQERVKGLSVCGTGPGSKRLGIDGDREAVPLTLQIIYSKVRLLGSVPDLPLPRARLLGSWAPVFKLEGCRRLPWTLREVGKGRERTSFSPTPPKPPHPCFLPMPECAQQLP